MEYDVASDQAKYAFNFTYSSPIDCGTLTTDINFVDSDFNPTPIDEEILEIDYNRNLFLVNTTNQDKVGTYDIMINVYLPSPAPSIILYVQLKIKCSIFSTNVT